MIPIQLIKSKRLAIDANIAKWVESVIEPEIKNRLNKLQEKCPRHKVELTNAMGATFIDIGKRRFVSSDFLNSPIRYNLERFDKKFPELKEIFEILVHLEDHFNIACEVRVESSSTRTPLVRFKHV